jgi:hypothetical protein
MIVDAGDVQDTHKSFRRDSWKNRKFAFSSPNPDLTGTIGAPK